MHLAQHYRGLPPLADLVGLLLTGMMISLVGMTIGCAPKGEVLTAESDLQFNNPTLDVVLQPKLVSGGEPGSPRFFWVAGSGAPPAVSSGVSLDAEVGEEIRIGWEHYILRGLNQTNNIEKDIDLCDETISGWEVGGISVEGFPGACNAAGHGFKVRLHASPRGFSISDPLEVEEVVQWGYQQGCPPLPMMISRCLGAPLGWVGAVDDVTLELTAMDGLGVRHLQESSLTMAIVPPCSEEEEKAMQCMQRPMYPRELTPTERTDLDPGQEEWEIGAPGSQPELLTGIFGPKIRISKIKILRGQIDKTGVAEGIEARLNIHHFTESVGVEIPQVRVHFVEVRLGQQCHHGPEDEANSIDVSNCSDRRGRVQTQNLLPTLHWNVVFDETAGYPAPALSEGETLAIQFYLEVF